MKYHTEFSARARAWNRAGMVACAVLCVLSSSLCVASVFAGCHLASVLFALVVIGFSLIGLALAGAIENKQNGRNKK